MTYVAQMNCSMSVSATRGLPIELTMLMPALLNRLKRYKAMQSYRPSVIGYKPRDLDKELYKARHLIENFFAKIKQYRAIATRYDKLASHFLSAIHLVSCVIWLN